MKGYVKNISRFPMYALKRHFLAGKRIPLDDLYAQYGEKHGLKPNEEFVNWLREVKLKDPAFWEITFETGEAKAEEKPEDNKVKVTGKITKTSDKKINLPVKAEPMAAGQVTGELTYEDVAGYSVRKAREEVPKIKDVKLLKYALNVANQRPNKETLCRILRKRIEEMHAVTV